MGLGTLDKTVDNSLFANDCTPFMCYTASQLFLAPGLYLPTFLIATLMRLFFYFPCLFTKKITSSLVVKHLAEFFHLKLWRFQQILQKQTNSGSYMGCVRCTCAVQHVTVLLHCTVGVYLQVRRTAAGRCCSPVWWWMTASPRGYTLSPWKRNTWTHSPPLLERKGEGGKS